MVEKQSIQITEDNMEVLLDKIGDRFEQKLHEMQLKNEWLSTNEVAIELGVNRQTIVNAIDSGKLKAVRAGKNFRINRFELKKYLDGKN